MQLKPRTKRSHLSLLTVLCSVLFVGQPAAHGEVMVTQVGMPIFDLVDTHLFAAPTDVFPSLFPTISRGPSMHSL